ncbi:MAG TPA: Do family serine endopeptidase [Ignavibacteriales bacterium]|nr:Do family serine endopeptidase [Ignavibacteriales bacterium]HPD68117.1 Do family serine endopeptidase [Ignavibacteriales bacterium]HRR18366.1 Do family serine endopeptidase [Ignavibacteriales bacterium]HRT99155.1 Do family serine endopeptidase [Ignavibacteriales bacterium]
MSRNQGKKSLAILMILGAFFTLVLLNGDVISQSFKPDIKIGADKPPLNINPKEYSSPFIEAAKKVTPSIVQIISVVERKQVNPFGDDDFFKFFPFFREPNSEQISTGSGVIISSDGYIVTNNHVIEDATKITVKLNDRREFTAKLIGGDPNSDLAIIKIEANNLQPAYFGNSDDVEVGQWVMALGNPLSLSSTVTAGIISAKHRRINLKKDSYGIDEYLQTDAAINPGNSGGALIDLSGSVIGINTAIASPNGAYVGYGFAIPSNLVKKVASDLIKYGKVNRGYLGVSIGEVDAATAKAIGLDAPKGVLVQTVVTGGAAEAADIKEGDVILKVDDKEVNQPNELQSVIGQKSAGDKVILTIYRDGKTITKTVTLRTKDNKETFADTKRTDKNDETIDENVNQLTINEIGLTVKNMSATELKDYGVDNGIMIVKVNISGTDAQRKLFPGLVIIKADNKNVSSVAEFNKIVKNKKGSAVLLLVQDKQKNRMFVGVNVE